MEWVRGDTLGHGSFATVSLAKPISQSYRFPPLMAVKSCGASHSASLQNEKLILDELRDCAQVIDCYGDSFSLENGEKLYNVMLEYAAGGSLAEKIKNSGDCKLPEFDVRRYAKSILKGLLCIHKIGYVHCDVKLQNVLVCEDGAVKIADFGLTKKAGINKGGLKSEIRGTPLYMSPETVNDGEQESPADIWALGCLVVEMLTGAPAWRFRQGSENIGALLMRIGVGDEIPEIPAKLSGEGKDFLEKCFLKNPRQRWTVEMLLNHPFISGHENQEKNTVPLKYDDHVPSISPRCHFDFPDWESSSETTPLPSPEFEQSWSMTKSPAIKLSELSSDVKPDWSVSSIWMTVR